jgi:hypothetical protein
MTVCTRHDWRAREALGRRATWKHVSETTRPAGSSSLTGALALMPAIFKQPPLPAMTSSSSASAELRERERERERQTERQRDRGTERQRQRQTDRQTDRESSSASAKLLSCRRPRTHTHTRASGSTTRSITHAKSQRQTTAAPWLATAAQSDSPISARTST